MSSGCQSTYNLDPCDDGNLCTINDVCLSGTCEGGATVVCDDGNPCTDDVCDWASGCQNQPDNSNPCDDGDSSTIYDFCVNGECIGT